MIKNKRLNFIVSLFDKNNDKILDIGTDHGYLLKEAFSKIDVKHAIAADINKEPLNNAKNNLKGLNVTYYLTDGFKNIKEDYNTVVIAGMGGILISNIMKDSNEDKNITYYLQPNNKEKKLRIFLEENNFNIIDEHVIYDKKYYVVIVAKKGKMTLTKEEKILGPILKTKQSALKYYEYLLKWNKYIIDKHDIKHGKIVEEYEIINKFYVNNIKK